MEKTLAVTKVVETYNESILVITMSKSKLVIIDASCIKGSDRSAFQSVLDDSWTQSEDSQLQRLPCLINPLYTRKP